MLRCRRMHEVGMAIDAGYTTLKHRCVILDRARVVTTAAGNAVSCPHIGESFLFEPNPVRLPDLGIAEIVRQFR